MQKCKNVTTHTAVFMHDNECKDLTQPCDVITYCASLFHL